MIVHGAFFYLKGVIIMKDIPNLMKVKQKLFSETHLVKMKKIHLVKMSLLKNYLMKSFILLIAIFIVKDCPLN